MPVVPCPACGAAASVESGRTAPCPGCGLLVSARPRVRAERAADPPAIRDRSALVWVALALVTAGVAVAGYAVNRQGEADREAMRARLEAMRADEWEANEEQVWKNSRAAWREFLAPVPARFTAPLPPEVAETRAAELRAALVGTWRGVGAAGGTREVEYRADGTFRDAATGPGAREWRGAWAVGAVSGSRVLRVTRSGGGPMSVKVSFEGDDLVHDDEPGAATVLRQR